MLRYFRSAMNTKHREDSCIDIQAQQVTRAPRDHARVCKLMLILVMASPIANRSGFNSVSLMFAY